MFDFLKGFDINSLRPHLKMAVQRIAIATSKKTQAIKLGQREVAKLLAEGKEEKAAIKVEAIIRDDATIEALGIIELMCDLVHERARLLQAEKECPEDLKPAVATLIYAANRADIAELHEVKKQFVKKWGKEWVERQETDADHAVNERVVHKLGIRPPSAALVQKYLMEIAKTAGVEWTPTEKPLTDEMAWQSMPAPSGATVPMAPATGFSNLYTNTNNKGGGGGGGGVPNPLPQGAIVATPISPAHGHGTSKEGFVPPPTAPATMPVPPPPPVVPAVPLTPSAPAGEEAPDSAAAVYEIPMPPTNAPVLPTPELPPPLPTSGSGDQHLGVSGSGGAGAGDVEDLEARFNRLQGRR